MPNYVEKEYAPLLDQTGQDMASNLTRIADQMTSPKRLDAEYGAKVTKENIDNMFVEWWMLADDGSYTKTQLLERWFNLLKDDKIFGSKVYNFEDSATSDGELTDYSVNLGVCVPSTETDYGKDNFCKEKAFWTVEVNYEFDANGETVITAVDNIHDEYSREGIVGMVGVAQKSAYFREYNDGTFQHLKYSLKKRAKYKLLPEAKKPKTNEKRAFVVHSKYGGGLDKNGIPTSATGLAPLNYNYSYGGAIDLGKKRGLKYFGMASCDNKFREMMFRLKYAKKGNSSTMAGCNNYYVTERPTLGETDVTRILLTKAQSDKFVVGSWVSVGTADRSSNNILKAVQIKTIKAVQVESQEYYAVYLDTETLISPTTEWYIATIPWGSGSCDNVLGVDGSPNNTNGKYPYIIQGLETQTGGWMIFADTIIQMTYENGVSTCQPYVYKNPLNVKTSIDSTAIAQTPFSAKQEKPNWIYVKDGNYEGDLTTPKDLSSGASSTTGCQCAAYLPCDAGLREWLAWGTLDAGSPCGLLCVNANAGLWTASWYIVGGAPGSGHSRGEWND